MQDDIWSLYKLFFIMQHVQEQAASAININVTFEEALRIIKSRWRCAVKWLRYRLLSRPDRCNCTEQSNVGACREDYISLVFALLGTNELLGPHLLRYLKKYVL